MQSNAFNDFMHGASTARAGYRSGRVVSIAVGLNLFPPRVDYSLTPLGRAFLDPAPQRKNGMSWREFLKTHKPPP